MKSSKPESRSSAPDQMDDSAFAVSNQVTSRKTVQSNCTVLSAGQEDTYHLGALLNSRATGQFMKDVNFRRKQKARAMKLAEKNGKENRINHSSCTKTTDVFTVLATIKLMIALQDNNNRLPPLATLQVVQVFIKTQVNSQTLHLHIAHTHSHTQRSQSTFGITTPTLTVTNPQFPQSFQHPPPAPVPQVNQQINYQVRPPQFNQQFTQPSLPQVSPLLMRPQPFNPQVLPPYFPQYSPSNSPSAGSNNSSILAALQKQWEKQERIDKEHFDMERQKEERKRMKEEREQKKEEQKRLEK